MAELVGIKVKIGLKPNGHAKYPDFNQLPSVNDRGMDWSFYVDAYGSGWQYDKTSGHRDNTDDSPQGQQWGMLLVPETFADEAVVAFSEDVALLTELEIEDFYNNKAHIYDEEEDIDQSILEKIKLKQDLNIPLTTQQQKALDPEDDTPGIRKNKKKNWVDYKKLKKITVKEKAT